MECMCNDSLPSISLLMLGIHSGKSESLTITNEKGQLVFDRIVAKPAEEDEAHRKRTQVPSPLPSFVYRLKTQLGHQDGLGDKISDEDEKTVLATVKENTERIDENGSKPSVGDLGKSVGASA